MAKKKIKNNSVAPLPFSADSSSSAPPPPIDGGGANPAVSPTSSERNSSQEPNPMLGLSPSSSSSTAGVKPSLMFATKLDSTDSDPERNRTAVILYSDEMKAKAALSQSHQRLNNNIAHVTVLAMDAHDRQYELRLSRNDDVGKETEFILTHEWGKLVADNGLKEGYSVAGYGNDDFIADQFRVFLHYEEGPPENQEPPEPEAEIFLFEKKMDGGDLKQPAIECCSNKMKMALQHTPRRNYIRVFAIDPKGEEHEMSFMREGSCFTFVNGWEKIVAENGVEEGDLVTGTGKISGHSINMRLHILKNVAEETNESKNRIGKATAILFFEKKLEFAAPIAALNLGRLDVVSCKDVVKAAFDEKLEAEGNDDGYVRVSATDEEGRSYDLRLWRYTRPEGKGAAHVFDHRWKKVVTDKGRLSRYVPPEGKEAVYVVDDGWSNVVIKNGLRSGDKVWCWGCFNEDGSIKMKITVDKALA